MQQTNSIPVFTLESCLTTEDQYNSFESIENVHNEMRGLKHAVRLYLYAVFGENNEQFKLEDTPDVDEALQVFGEVDFGDAVEEDYQQEESNVLLKKGQYICFKDHKNSANGNFLYGQVHCFLEVRYANGKLYKLCAGVGFEDLKKPHPTGRDGDDTFLLNHDWKGTPPFGEVGAAEEELLAALDTLGEITVDDEVYEDEEAESDFEIEDYRLYY
ncbi:hypothetical protein V8B55DRAFT_1379598 [Mucor lusitanicus]|uniref:Uncharacterized protein n=1 Tax=Mucor lusitanicus CBS 277.49 TaxID=747725 RepID=A0A168HN82_MUCCL|nr:hypothetical protein MUCCIDRAFT_114154 [Mucor lusitanicus CBS 277.49]